MKTAIFGKRLGLAMLLGVLISCAPRVGEVTSAPSSGEASVFLGDLAVAEGDVVLISRRHCVTYKPAVRKCRSEPIETARVVHVEETSQGRYAVIALPSTVAIRSGDFVTTF